MMITSTSFVFFFLLCSHVSCQVRGDIDPDEVETDGTRRVSPQELECSCASKVAGAVILTIICMLVVVAFVWCFYKQKKKGLGGGKKFDVEGAAYDNPQFQGDDLESGKENRKVAPCINASPRPGGVKGPSTKLASIATNTTSTLERGKTTLERVMASVISSGKSFSPKKTKDDSFISEPRYLAVPLQAHDFSGLGFTVHGNLKHGIYIKEILSRGPAVESKQIVVGDKVSALTVFFEHMVYEDACKILSYALPYPVLLHLEKNQNPCQVPLMLGTTPKGGKTPSTKIVHPIFRSQSHSELIKLSPMDLKKLRLGNISPPKNKGLSPLNIPKIPHINFAQRDAEGRHSERAIDVPGVDAKPKLSSCEISIDGVARDKKGLTNVEVHRPMSPSVAIEIPDGSIATSCAEAPLTDVKENISCQKPKFGIRVLPDLGFQKKTTKVIDIDAGTDVGIDLPDAGVTSDVKIEKDIKVSVPELNVQLPKLITETKQKSVHEAPVTAEIKESEIEIVCENEKEKKSKGKFGFGFGHLEFKRNSKSEESKDEGNKEKNGSSKSHSGFGLNIEGPSWKPPSFDFKFKSKDKDEVQKDGKDIKIEKDVNLDIDKPKSRDIELESDIEKPSAKISGNNSRDTLDFKIKKPDINIPSFNFKKEKKVKDNQSEQGNEKETEKKGVRRKDSSSDGESTGFGISIKRPDIKLPSFELLHGKSKGEEEEQVETDAEKKVKKERKKSKEKSGFNFKFKTPDFSMPTFSTKEEKLPETDMKTTIAKSADATADFPKVDVDNQIDVNVEAKNVEADLKMPDFVSNLESYKSNEKVESTSDVNIPAVDVSLPAFDLKKDIETPTVDSALKLSPIEVDMNRPEMLVEAINAEAIPELKADVNLSSAEESLKISSPKIEPSLIAENQDSESSKWDLGINMPDISLPSLNLKKGNKEEDTVKPDVEDTSSKENEGENIDGKKKFSFGMKLPDVTLPSFGFDSDKKGTNNSPKVEKDSMNIDGKIERSQIDIKENINLELDAPKFNLEKPQLSNKETVVVNLNIGDNPPIDFSPPDITADTQFNLSTKGKENEKTESDEGDKEIQEEEESTSKKSKKKKGFGFKIKGPDFEMPDFKLKHGHKQYSLDETDASANLKSQVSVNKTMSLEGKYTDAPENTDSDVPHVVGAKEDVKKKRSFGFNLKMPEINLPDFKFKQGEKIQVESAQEIPSPDSVTLETRLPEIDLDVENENNENVIKAVADAMANVESGLNLPDAPTGDAAISVDAKSDDIKVASSDSKFGLNVKMPSLNLTHIDFPSKKEEKGESESQEQSIAHSDEAKMNLQTDLNATDATKKKRFGIKFSKPNIVMPHFSMNKDSNSDLENQSDEMKSLHLRLKSPELPIQPTNPSFESEPDSNLSISDAMKTEADLSLGLSDDDLQMRSDEWKMREMTDDSKRLESNVAQISHQMSENLKVNLPDVKPVCVNEEEDQRTTKEIFGVKLRSPKVSLPECDVNPEIETDIQSNKKLSTASIELSFNNCQSSKSTNIETNSISVKSTKEFESDLPEADSDLKIKPMDLPEVDFTMPRPDLSINDGINIGDISKIDFIAPEVTTSTQLNLSNENKENEKTESEEEEKEVQEEEESASKKGKKKKGFGFKIKAPDFEIPDFKLKHGNKQHSLDEVVASANPINVLDNEIEVNTLDEKIQQALAASVECDAKDLPEVDIAMSKQAIELPTQAFDISAPQSSVEYSVNRNGKVEKETKEPRVMDYSTASDSEDEKPTKVGVDVDMKLKKSDEQKALISSKPEKDLEEEDKTRHRGKLGLGFGFKGFGRTSDSEDNETDNRISDHPNSEIKDKKRFGGKMSFGLKNFGRSSDTEEESSDIKVSDHPMEKESDKSNKPKSLGFGFKSKSNRSSDSEDAGESEKVDVDPEADAHQKKNKSKLATKNDDETRSRVKTFSFTSRSSKDSKSESEVGEEEKSSLEVKDDQKGKHKYSIGFGFRKNSGKSTSDSEGGEYDEKKVSMDAKGTSEKSKEHKPKSLKLGFKGFKNLKGKIQTEINKMRHDSSDEEYNMPHKTDESHKQGEKRKKITKKKEKDKKVNHEEATIDDSEEVAMSSAANAAKENRRKRLPRASSSSSASTESSSDEEENQQKEKKKKKKSKSKRIDDSKIPRPGIINIEIPDKEEEAMEVVEEIMPTEREIRIPVPTFADGQTLQEIPVEGYMTHSSPKPEVNEEKAVTSDEENTPKRYIVVKEMKLKKSTSSIEMPEVNEIIEKVTVEKKIPPPLLMGERIFTDTDGGSWGSDSDMDRRQQNDADVSLSETSMNIEINNKQRLITDSEELKRKATSLGDLSRLHEGIGVGTLLERAVSLDLNTASVGSSNLHVRRLRLPDSSATSIDEVDEALAIQSPKKLEPPSGLKAASRWGTLEDALLLEGTGLDYDMDEDSDGRTNGEGGPISNIEISGGKGSSVTALSSGRGSWNESFDEETPPALPTSPIPHGATTITVNDSSSNSSISDQNASDASIVIVPSDHTSNGIINFVQTNDLITPHLTSLESKMSIPLNQETFEINEVNSRIRQDSDFINSKLQNEKDGIFKLVDGDINLQNSQERDDAGGVTVTMVPADDYSLMNVTSTNGNPPPPVPPKPKAGKSFSSSDVISYDSGMQAPLVTVNHDYIKENGDALKDSDHNLSDEYITPDSSPEKSMTQITLDGDGLSGYTVTEGTFSRTVIISNPDSSSPVSIVQTDGDSSIPILQSRHE